MSSVCLLTIGDGRDAYHDLSRASLTEMLPDVAHHVEIDDREHRLGFAGAVKAGWEAALETGAEYVFHAELDFTYLHPVKLAAMTHVLDEHDHLVQMALLRGPVNAAERAAGGIIEQHPDAYRTVRCCSLAWREHRRFVTTNPCLWPRWVIARGWPLVDQSEGRFGIELFAEHQSLHAAFWGTTVDVEHIGHERAGTGY